MPEANAIDRRKFLKTVGFGSFAAFLNACKEPEVIRWEKFIDTYQLQGDDGKPLAAEKLVGKNVVINFGFLGCQTVCPINFARTNQMAHSAATNPDDNTVFLTVSVEPLVDSAEALKKANQQYNSYKSTNWIWARPGSDQTLLELCRRVAPGGLNILEDRNNHTGGFYLIGSDGIERGAVRSDVGDSDYILAKIQENFAKVRSQSQNAKGAAPSR